MHAAMASSQPVDLKKSFDAKMRHRPTAILVKAVCEGNNEMMKSALARGAHADITVPTDTGKWYCLLTMAAANGDKHLLPRLLQEGLNIEGGGFTEKTPLMEAAGNGHPQTVKALLAHDANPLATDKNGLTALYYAALGGHQQCVVALLPVTPPSSTLLEGKTPVHTASFRGHVEVLQQLAGAGWPLSTRDSEGNTPLHHAAMGGSMECVEWLVQQGCDRQVQNKAGHTPVNAELVVAVDEGDETRVKSALDRGALPEVTVLCKDGKAACLVALAVTRGHNHLLPLLLKAGLNIEGGGTIEVTPLMEAAWRGLTHTVKTLLRLGANPLAANSEGRIALDYAAERDQQQCVAALLPVTPSIPAHVEAYTPVHTASYYGHTEVLKQLSGAGWSLTIRDSYGNTPLHQAVFGGSVIGVDWLLQRGCDLRVKNKDGHTPLDTDLLFGVEKGDEARVKSALDRGALPEVTIPTEDGKAACLVTLAAAMGHNHLLPLLLKAGLNIEGGGTIEVTPLMEAARYGLPHTVKTLLRLGANPLATDSKGRIALDYAALWDHQQCVAALLPVTPSIPTHVEACTPVHTASYFGHTEVLEQLSGAGWSLTARDGDGNTPLHYAVLGGRVTGVDWLLQRGGDLRVQNKDGHTPLDEELIFAVGKGDEARMKSALDRGAIPEVTVPTEDGKTACMVALAVIRGYSHLLPLLLKAGLDIEGGGTIKTTPLMEAAWLGHIHTVKILLSHGANPLAADSKGRTALHHAAAMGQQQCVTELMPITPPTSAPLDEHTPVHTACFHGQVEILEQLASGGCSLTARDSDGNTALHYAVVKGSMTCMEWLVQRGIDLHMQNKNGYTPFDLKLVIAVKKGDETMMKSALAMGAHPDVTVPIGSGVSQCLVSVAAARGHSHLLPHLHTELNIEGRGNRGTTPLLLAAFNGHTQTVKVLLTLGANPLATDSRGRTALHYAVGQDHNQRVAALTVVAPSIPANLETHTPVHTANFHDQVEVLEQLSRAGCPLNARDIDGDTPLHCAVAHGSVTGVDWLLQHGGDLCMQNKAGHTPLEKELVIAVEKGDEARMRSALAIGARPEVTIPTTSGVSECLVTTAARMGHDHLLPHLLQVGLEIKGGGSRRGTPLFSAAANGHVETVKALLTLGANPLATNRNGETALHCAAREGHLECVAALIPVTPPITADFLARTPVHTSSYFGQREVLEQLKDAGWPLTTRDSNGNTPLHWAAMGGHLPAVQWLVQRGSDLRALSKFGFTPMDAAVQHGRHEVETWLAKKCIGYVVRREERLVQEVTGWRSNHERHHEQVLSMLKQGNQAGIMAQIPKHIDGHALNQEGLTPLHAAAQRRVPSDAVIALLECGVNPHVLTPDNMTPADLARQSGHEAVIKELDSHHCAQGGTPHEDLYEELLSTISCRDDVEAVSRLLCKGAPIGPLGNLSALRLAVTTDRALTVSLLLASGAPLSSSLLQEAWQSNNVTHRVLAYLTTAYCCRLRAEKRRLVKVSRTLVKGIENLLEDIEGNTPWRASWRISEDTDRAALSYLMAKAAAANCPVTAAFLRSAGAWPFFSQTSGGSALHAALDASQRSMAMLLIRDLGGCPYVPDTQGRLPLHIMTKEERMSLEQRLFEEEREKLEEMGLRKKADREKAAAQTAQEVQKDIFNSYVKREDKNVSEGNARTSLLLATRKGLLQLTHLLLKEGHLPVDEVLDDTCGTTAIHEAAAHGQDGCVALLVSAGANTQQRDTYGQTPRLLAAMFGHKSTADLLALYDLQDPACRAGTTAKQVARGFEGYLQLYKKYNHDPLTPFDRHDPDRVTRKLMKCISIGNLQQEAQRVVVDFSGGEALQIHKAVMAELKAIMEKVSVVDPTYRGDLRLVGSSRDGSKLYAPDEFDVNIVIQGDGVGINVSERGKEEASLKGRLQISVNSDNPHLKGNSLMANLYEEMHRCLVEHTLKDQRLSLVPPGLTSTQVGVALTLAWQGQEYPLLVIGVDLVPVLEVPWPKEIPKPFLTPKDTTTMQISNAADGTWRCSFALTEAKVLETTLSPAERQTQLMGKVILSYIKAERWMPWQDKSFCSWFETREWRIPVPSGFCLKNAFLQWLDHRWCEELDHAKQLGAWREGDSAKQLEEWLERYSIKQPEVQQTKDPNMQLEEGQEGYLPKMLEALQKWDPAKKPGSWQKEYPAKKLKVPQKGNPAKQLAMGQQGDHTKQFGTENNGNPVKKIVAAQKRDPTKRLVVGQKGDPAKQLGMGHKEDPAKQLGTGQKEDPAKQLGTGQKEDPAKQLKMGQKEDPAKNMGTGRDGDPIRWLVEVFRLMCANPEESREHLTVQNCSAYFGGDCEGRKPGYGAPIIVQCLEEDLEES